MDIGLKIKKNLDCFIGQLKAGISGALESVILYGSTASGERAKAHSDINVLIVLKNVGLEDLRGIARVKKQGRFRGINPLVLSLDYLSRSADTFPIEFLDMKENHFVLYGDDCLKCLKIELFNLRHQCEWELKSKIIQMQKFYINSGGRDAALKNFLLKNLPSFKVIFKNILRLKNTEEFNIDPQLLNSISGARMGKYKLNNGQGAFEKFLFELERLSDAVDKL